MKLKVVKSLGKSPGVFFKEGDEVSPSTVEAATLLTKYPNVFEVVDEDAKSLKAALDGGTVYTPLEALANLEE